MITIVALLAGGGQQRDDAVVTAEHWPTSDALIRAREALAELMRRHWKPSPNNEPCVLCGAGLAPYWRRGSRQWQRIYCCAACAARDPGWREHLSP